MKQGDNVSKEDKADREKQAAEYKAAKWTMLFRLNGRGGGKGRMVRGDGN